MGRHDQPVTHLLTGDRGSGKSTVVQRISDRLDSDLAGVLSRPVHLSSGERSGIDAVLLPGGGTEVTTIPLARVSAAALAEISRNRYSPGGAGRAVQHYRLAAASDPFPPHTRVTPVGPYHFSVTALTAVNDHLFRIAAGAGTLSGLNAVSNAGTPSGMRTLTDGSTSVPNAIPNVIVIDEIGPLELRNKDGFWPGLSSLWTDLRPLILVVRPELVEQLTGCAVAAGRRVGAVHVVTTASISATADAIVTAVEKEPLI
jgi:nucleoside-triphosphatase THEP1